jgi:hypothetical protein
MTNALRVNLLRRSALQLALVPLAGAAAGAPLPSILQALAAAPRSGAGAFFEGVGGRSTLGGEDAAEGGPSSGAPAPPFGFS